MPKRAAESYNYRMVLRFLKNSTTGPLRALILGLAACWGCVSTYHPPDWTQVPKTSSVDGSTMLAELTPEQREALCVWKATVLGGFGKKYECLPKPCKSGECEVTIRVWTGTRDRCRHEPAAKAECKATVADDERCMVRMSANVCARDWRSEPECSAVFSCWRPE